MSIDTCATCAAAVDTDFDEDAYAFTLPSGDQIKQVFCRCASCREERGNTGRIDLEEVSPKMRGPA
jgi:hypothetical protein